MIPIEIIQAFTWQIPGGEAITWSIPACKELIGDREPRVLMNPEHCREVLRRNGSADEIDDAYAMTKDLSEPLIAIASPNPMDAPGAMILIDGWHRVKKAVLTNHPEPLNVHILSRVEELLCRIYRK